jgi:hypothetical protein
LPGADGHSGRHHRDVLGGDQRALTDFALTLERYLEGFQMVHLVSDAGKLAGFLPRPTELMERSRILIVIDNAESPSPTAVSGATIGGGK